MNGIITRIQHFFQGYAFGVCAMPGGEIGRRNLEHQALFYLRYLHYSRLTGDCIPGYCLRDEPSKTSPQKEPGLGLLVIASIPLEVIL